jgi:hypothetical protein
MNTARDNERDKFLAQSNLNRSDSTLMDDIKMGASDLYEKGKGLLSPSPENIMQEVDPSLLAASQQQELDMPLGPDNQGGGPAIDQALGGYQALGGSPHDGTAPEEEGEGLMAKLGGMMSSDSSSDSSKTKPLSKGKMAGIKIATDLLTGANRDAPILAPSAGVKMGRASFPGLLAASQRPVNPRYTPKGLG